MPIRDIRRAGFDDLQCKSNSGRHAWIPYDISTVIRKGISKYEFVEECQFCDRKRVTVLPVTLIKRSRNGKRNWSYRYVDGDGYKHNTQNFTAEDAKRELIRRITK